MMILKMLGFASMCMRKKLVAIALPLIMETASVCLTWSRKKWRREVMPDSQPETMESIPRVVLFYSVISFHLVKLTVTEQVEEAQFHWRQIRYYRDEWRNLNPDLVWPTEEEFFKQLCDDGQCCHITAAIKKHNLLDTT
jgi:hypothetical protein